MGSPRRIGQAESEWCSVSIILYTIFIVEVRNCIRNYERNYSLMNDFIVKAGECFPGELDSNPASGTTLLHDASSVS